MEAARGWRAESPAGTGTAAGTRYWWTLLPGVLLFTVLRVPSFLEPAWYTDEAGYATTARALLQGKTLYLQIWTNKPPLHPWTVAMVMALVGPVEWGLHALTYLSGLLALAGLAYAATRLLSPVRSVVAVVVGAALLGAPLLGTELSIPENLLIAPAAWAGAVLLTRVRSGGRWWPVAVGALGATAIAYQQTALADAAAFGVIILFAAPRPLRSLAVYVLTLALGTALWLVPSVILAGPSRVAFALVGFYIPFTASVLPQGHGGMLRDAALLVVATATALLGAFLLRRHRVVVWGSWFWTIAAALVTGAAHQPYAHYLIPVIVPFALALAAVPLPSSRLLRVRPLAGLVAIAAAIAITGTLASVVRYDGTVAKPWLGAYYSGFAGVVAGRESLATWQDWFDDRVASDEGVTAWIRAHHLEGSRAVVWSGDAWPYLSSDLQLVLPTAPIYNDEVLFGQHGPVAARVARLQPKVIITSRIGISMFPEIKPLLRRQYHEAYQSGIDTVWVRNGAAGGGP